MTWMTATISAVCPIASPLRGSRKRDKISPTKPTSSRRLLRSRTGNDSRCFGGGSSSRWAAAGHASAPRPLPDPWRSARSVYRHPGRGGRWASRLTAENGRPHHACRHRFAACCFDDWNDNPIGGEAARLAAEFPMALTLEPVSEARHPGPELATGGADPLRMKVPPPMGAHKGRRHLSRRDRRPAVPPRNRGLSKLSTEIVSFELHARRNFIVR